jgi:hypothetical protein
MKPNINIIGSNLPHANLIAGVYSALFEAMAVPHRPYNREGRKIVHQQRRSLYSSGLGHNDSIIINIIINLQALREGKKRVIRA